MIFNIKLSFLLCSPRFPLGVGTKVLLNVALSVTSLTYKVHLSGFGFYESVMKSTETRDLEEPD